MKNSLWYLISFVCVLGVIRTGSAEDSLHLEQRAGISQDNIPPSAGFSADFKALHERPLTQNQSIVDELRTKLDSEAFPFLYEYARRRLDSDPEDAIVAFWRAGIRMRYDAYRCTDKTARDAIRLWPGIANNVAEAMSGEKFKDLAPKLALRAVELEKTVPIDYPPVTVCYHGMATVQAQFEGNSVENIWVPKAKWRAVHDDVLQKAGNNFARSRRAMEWTPPP